MFQLDEIRKVIKLRPQPFVYHWSILGVQRDIENALGIKKDTPTTLALSPITLVKIARENVVTADELLAFLDSDESLTDKFDHTKIKFKTVNRPWKPASKKQKKESSKQEL